MSKVLLKKMSERFGAAPFYNKMIDEFVNPPKKNQVLNWFTYEV